MLGTSIITSEMCYEAMLRFVVSNAPIEKLDFLKFFKWNQAILLGVFDTKID